MCGSFITVVFKLLQFFNELRLLLTKILSVPIINGKEPMLCLLTFCQTCSLRGLDFLTPPSVCHTKMKLFRQSALPKDTTSEFAGIFSTQFLLYWMSNSCEYRFLNKVCGKIRQENWTQINQERSGSSSGYVTALMCLSSIKKDKIKVH